ncbi:hypothetical protein [Pseudomarimonas salicorniae]|uniref:Uncharacterized protein n=1 Tax=Pseudomarimonas salicorniae TaxID=2933270 RepID=A0ABT0GGW3_9GAMM|nr:hypothetical protein [Lysobacter sp. CAU 1642]MCK7593786.1 hypothetical protein [Lysobacter sp. CAU 1642]
MSGSKRLTLILAPLVLAAAAYWLWVGPSAEVPDSAPRPAAPPPAAAPLVEQPSAAEPVAVPAPWMLSRDVLQGEPREDPAAAARAAKATAYQQVQDELATLTANGRQPSIAEVDKVLQRITEVEGRSQVAGVDIAAVRRHMAIAAEMQTLAVELQTLSAQGAGSDTARVQALIKRMEALREDLVASPVVVAPQP